jgi:hypothetical protein
VSIFYNELRRQGINWNIIVMGLFRRLRKVFGMLWNVVVVTDLFGSVRERVKAFTRIECKFCIGGGRSFDQLTVRW